MLKTHFGGLQGFLLNHHRYVGERYAVVLLIIPDKKDWMCHTQGTVEKIMMKPQDVI